MVITKLPHDVSKLKAREWYAGVVQYIGEGFHPDTPANDYIHVDTSERLFDDATAELLDHNIELCSTHFDLYEEALIALELDGLETSAE